MSETDRMAVVPRAAHTASLVMLVVGLASVAIGVLAVFSAVPTVLFVALGAAGGASPTSFLVIAAVGRIVVGLALVVQSLLLLRAQTALGSFANGRGATFETALLRLPPVFFVHAVLGGLVALSDLATQMPLMLEMIGGVR